METFMKININKKVVYVAVSIVCVFGLIYLTFTESIGFQAVLTFIQLTWGKIVYLLLIGCCLWAI